MQSIETLLDSVSQEKRDNLAKLLPQEKFSKRVAPTAKKLVEALRWAHDSTFIGTVFRDPKSYHDILRTVAKHLEISSEHSTAKIEELICQKIGQDIFKKMNDTQRAAFTAAIEKESAKHSGGSGFIGAGGVAAALVAGNLGGFSTYMLASTGLAAVAGTVGLTLPFAAYTGLSAALGVALGPVGWVGLGLVALFSIGGPSFDKLIPAILYIVMLRNDPDAPH